MEKQKDNKKKLTQYEREIEEKRKRTNLDYPERVQYGEGVVYVREDQAVKYAEEMPVEMKERFLIRRKRKSWYNPLSWFGGEEEYRPKGNLLLLMDNESNIRLYDKVKPGYFRINQLDKDDGGEEKYLILKPYKLRNITFEDENGKEEYWKGWVADINNVNALPENPSYDCEDVSQLINRAVSGNKEFNRKDKGMTWGWVKWVAIGLVIVYLGYMVVTKNLFGVGDLVGYVPKSAKVGADVIANSGVTNIVPGGSIA